MGMLVCSGSFYRQEWTKWVILVISGLDSITDPLSRQDTLTYESSVIFLITLDWPNSRPPNSGNGLGRFLHIENRFFESLQSFLLGISGVGPVDVSSPQLVLHVFCLRCWEWERRGRAETWVALSAEGKKSDYWRRPWRLWLTRRILLSCLWTGTLITKDIFEICFMYLYMPPPPYFLSLRDVQLLPWQNESITMTDAKHLKLQHRSMYLKWNSFSLWQPVIIALLFLHSFMQSDHYRASANIRAE